MSRFECRVRPAYGQFYLEDIGVAARAPEEVTDEDIARRMKVGEGMVAVYVPDGAESVALTVQVYNREPEPRPEQWDQVVECSLALPTGRLGIGTPDTGPPTPVLEVTPGMYRVRGQFVRLGRWSGDPARGRSLSHYYFNLWLAESCELRVLKLWHGREVVG